MSETFGRWWQPHNLISWKQTIAAAHMASHCCMLQDVLLVMWHFGTEVPVGLLSSISQPCAVKLMHIYHWIAAWHTVKSGMWPELRASPDRGILEGAPFGSHLLLRVISHAPKSTKLEQHFMAGSSSRSLNILQAWQRSLFMVCQESAPCTSQVSSAGLLAMSQNPRSWRATSRQASAAAA